MNYYPCFYILLISTEILEEKNYILFIYVFSGLSLVDRSSCPIVIVPNKYLLTYLVLLKITINIIHRESSFILGDESKRISLFFYKFRTKF